MAKKRKAYLHVGLPGAGDVIDGALVTHRHALAALGVNAPAESSEEMFRAAIEIRRAHCAWGYQRREVEGAWSGICRRALRGKDPVVVSQSMLAAAEKPQIDLLLDTLPGLEIHVVVTVAAPDAWTSPGDLERDLGTVLDRWRTAVRRPERLHVVVLPADGDRDAAWKAFGRIVGFGTASLSVRHVPPSILTRALAAVPTERRSVVHAMAHSWLDQLTASEYDVRGDVADLVRTDPAPTPDGRLQLDHALLDALHEVERLRRRNDSLEARMGELARKRRRRLSVVA